MDEISEYTDEEKISNLNISFDSDDFNSIDFTAQKYKLNIESELNGKSDVVSLQSKENGNKNRTSIVEQTVVGMQNLEISLNSTDSTECAYPVIQNTRTSVSPTKGKI